MKLSKKMSDDLNYLNMQEIKKICSKYKIPYKIYFEKEKKLKQSSEKDRKGIVLARIRHFLSTGKIKDPTITLEEALENIDIGGPTMIRAAAKNFQFVRRECE